VIPNSTIAFKITNRSGKSADVGGYKINYLDSYSFTFLFGEVFINQVYFFTTTKPRPIIVDCGSNIGMSILYFKCLYPDSTIIAFEPDEDTFTCLEQNIAQNDLQSVEAHRAAISHSEGRIPFYYDADVPGALLMSTVRERLPKDAKLVDAVQLSRHINAEIDFLKMDIEGAELAAIDELNQAGKLRLVSQMAIEYHHHIVEEEDMLSQMLGTLERAGFGYQLSGELSRPFRGRQFQDILIYAYRK